MSLERICIDAAMEIKFPVINTANDYWKMFGFEIINLLRLLMNTLLSGQDGVIPSIVVDIVDDIH